ncbi:hypothetical protein [Murimonas intestini]|uniref:Uncharacterized protein n=1 Tax=Murimonas intestini TaxID=1337051 RepID=A0AB73TAU7_9FIRM|nr:hypothetical protein [Murimonas intestini]MCR1838771.1 hypothetical protein [Murimonas intestini]MCR1864071.1 hypothetical protein [Murimonas intestini]MCR1881681.1 hypothetical protein [Murimonas intestini]
MKRIIGYTLFWIAIGMLLALFLPNILVAVLTITLLLIGYNIFCSC